MKVQPDAPRDKTRGSAIGLVVRRVGGRIGLLERRRASASPRAAAAKIGERPDADGGEQRRAVRRPFLAIHRAHRHAEHLGLQPSDERSFARRRR